MDRKESLAENELILIVPSIDLKEEVHKYKEEHFKYGDRQIHGSCGLTYYNDYDEWLNLVNCYNIHDVVFSHDTNNRPAIEDGQVLDGISSIITFFNDAQ